jgi:TonB family protein
LKLVEAQLVKKKAEEELARRQAEDEARKRRAAELDAARRVSEGSSRAPETPPRPAPTVLESTAPVPRLDPSASGAPPPLPPSQSGPGSSAKAPTGMGGLHVDVPFHFPHYLRHVNNLIMAMWFPPRGASVGGEIAVVLFEIDREGQIKEPSVERSSGNAIYDQSAVRAVLEASPFPPLPQGFPGRSLRVHFGFEYKPEQG